jgi:hypothetical protein
MAFGPWAQNGRPDEIRQLEQTRSIELIDLNNMNRIQSTMNAAESAIWNRGLVSCLFPRFDRWIIGISWELV